MNLKEMNPDDLFKYIDEALTRKDKQKLEKIASCPNIVEYLRETFSSDRIILYKPRINQIVVELRKIKNMITLRKIFENPENYSVDERRKILESARQQESDLSYLWERGKNFKAMITYIRSNFDDLETNPELEKEELEVVEIFGKILEFKKKNNKPYDLCHYMFLDLGIGINQKTRLDSMKDLLLKAFLKSMMYETSIKVFERISLEDMKKLDNIIKYFNDSFPKKIYPTETKEKKPEITPIEEEKISKLLDLIYILEKKYNHNYYKILYVLTHDCNISYEMIRDEYLPMCGAYSSNRFKGTPEEKEMFSKIYTFLLKIPKVYSGIMYGNEKLKKYIISNIDNSQIIKELYFLLFFHKAKPASNKNRFYLYLEFEGKKEIERFALGYQEYYKEEMEKQEKRQQEEDARQQEDEFLESLSKYEIIINEYIESGLPIESYCEKNGITIYDFRKIINDLKKHNHPLYETYDAYANNIKGKKFAIIRAYVDNMIKNLMSNPKYTLLDYYTDIKMKPEDVAKMLRDDPINVRNTFKKFCQKYPNDSPLPLDKALEIDKEYAIKDSEGKIIQMYKILPEEKQQVFNMLKQQNIPVTTATFFEQLRRFFENEIKPRYTGGQK